MRLFAALLTLLLALAAVLGFNLMRLPQLPAATAPAMPLAVDETALAERLAMAVRFPTTVSGDALVPDTAAFEAFRAHLRATYADVYAALDVETINGSLLLTWTGRDRTAAAGLFAAHMDVVPVAAVEAPLWTHPPYAGVIADGYIWGRGTLDDKSSLVAWLEAARLLRAQGFAPRQTLYFAFGHDEETGGDEGARAIADTLRERGVVLDFVLDEGGIVGLGLVAGVERPVATVMTAEKGYVTYKLSAHIEGGHSSMPPPATAVGTIARAISRLEANPMPARLQPPLTDMLEHVAAATPLAQRLAIANRWLSGPLLIGQLERAKTTNAMLRTTTAPTVIRGGVKENVLPARAHALVNFRLLPGDTPEDVANHIRAVVDDPAVTIERVGDWTTPASQPSPTDSAAYAAIATAIREVVPDALVVPGLVVGATDARHYAPLAASRYNFIPMTLNADDIARIHGIDERISVRNYADIVRFYVRLLERIAD